MKRHSIWVALIVLIAASLACAIPLGVNTVRGSGVVVTEAREVSGFESVALSGVGQVIITQGDEESLTIETDDNLMRYIETEVGNGRLDLRIADNTIPIPSQSIIFRVSVDDLTGLTSSGAGSFEIGELEADRLRVTLSGAGDIGIDSLSATDLAVKISGAGNVDLAGQVGTQDIHLSGLGRYSAPDLESQKSSLRISGAGGAVIWAQDTLDVTISGAGNVEYYGSPTVTQEISGAGKITSRGDK
jgi:hypothetical protein